MHGYGKTGVVDQKVSRPSTDQKIEAAAKEGITKEELKFIRHIGLLRNMRVIFTIVGIMGFLFGVYCLLFADKPLSSSGSLIAFYGISCLGWELFKACKVIQKSNDRRNDQSLTDGN